jgi:hypothetical protein
MFLVIRKLDHGDYSGGEELSYPFVTDDEMLAKSWAFSANEEVKAARHAYDARYDSVEKNSVLNQTNWIDWIKKILKLDGGYFEEVGYDNVYDIEYEVKEVAVR